MTLIVIHGNTLYTDSCVVYGGARQTKQIKLRETNGIKWCCAGDVEDAYAAMDYAAEFTSDSWHTLDFTKFHTNSRTVIFALVEGIFKMLDLTKKIPTWYRVPSGDESGFRMSHGSGWQYYQAYFDMTNDVNESLALTARYHRDVSGPFVTMVEDA